MLRGEVGHVSKSLLQKDWDIHQWYGPFKQQDPTSVCGTTNYCSQIRDDGCLKDLVIFQYTSEGIQPFAYCTFANLSIPSNLENGVGYNSRHGDNGREYGNALLWRKTLSLLLRRNDKYRSRLNFWV